MPLCASGSTPAVLLACRLAADLPASADHPVGRLNPWLWVQVRTDMTTRAMSRSVSLIQDEGGAALRSREFVSPCTTDALEALDALVAAAGYAGKHGTPAIQAALAAGAAEGGTGGAGGGQLAAFMHQGLSLQPWQQHMQPKRRCTGAEAGAGGEAEQLAPKQEWQQLLQGEDAAARAWHAGFAAQQGPPASSLAAWQPADQHVLMFQAIEGMLGEHQWDAEEQAALARFKARYAWLDGCGREVVYLQASQLRGDKPALFSFAAEVAQGSLAQAPAAANEQEPGPLAAAQPTPAGVPQQGKPYAALSGTPDPAALYTDAMPASTAAAGVSSAALHMGLEASASLQLPASSSFNLDVLMHPDCEPQPTPSMHALGPAL